MPRAVKTLEERESNENVVFESAATNAPRVGPAEAIKRAAAIVLGEDPVKDPGNFSIEEEVNKKVLAQGKYHTRLFRFTVQKDADDYAELYSKQQRGLVHFDAVKELTSGVEYALFIRWVEFEKPQEDIKEKVTAEVTKNAEKMMRRASKRPAMKVAISEDPEEALPIDDGLCRGNSASGKPCKGKRVEGTLHCRHHQLTEMPTMDSPPPTHTGLGS